VLHEAGIAPALLTQPEARVPASAFAALWLIQIRELNDEFFRLDSHGMPPGSFALICRGLIQEPNLGKALTQCLASFALFLRDFRGSLSVHGKRAVLSLDIGGGDEETRRYGEETFLVLMISLLCWLGGRRVPIDRADFRHARAPSATINCCGATTSRLARPVPKSNLPAATCVWRWCRTWRRSRYFCAPRRNGW
jgi:hypothetical protein